MLNNADIKPIIDGKLVQPHFQAIINFYTEDYFAFEALIRTSLNSPPIRPDQLFTLAENQGYLLEFDWLCVTQAIEYFQLHQLPSLLFVNILPINLGKILPLLAQKTKHLPLKGIVLEISEKHPLPNLNELKEYIKVLRQHGALIAIDDLGAGHSGLITWAEIKPDFVKIDRHFIFNIHSDSVKREFVRSIIEIARGLRCKVIAEGIENIEELEILHDIGIKLGQGFLLHRPEASPLRTFKNKHCFKLLSKPQKLSRIRHSETAESLMEKITSIAPSTTAEAVNDIFKNNAELQCIPVTQENLPLGIISRSQILEVFSGRYSHQLHGKKPIQQLITSQPIIVDHQESLINISNKVTSNQMIDLNADFIITKNKSYYGVGKVSTLLKLLTDTQIQRARHSNPLTLLPGNVPIDEHINDLISQEQAFHLAYFDINHFKPFNDYFGYSSGDDVIKRLADIITEKTTYNLDMVGHIGGDDFVVVFRSNNWEQKCQAILTEFKSYILRFYTKEEIAKQGIYYKDRRGNRDFFNLLSLAIGVIHPDVSMSTDHHDISKLASDAKKEAKKIQGNALFISRRRSKTPNPDTAFH